MVSFKTRDKPFKNARKKVVIVATVMLCVLSIGLLSSFTVFASAFSGSSSGGSSLGGSSLNTGPIVKPPDADDDNTGDSGDTGDQGDPQAVQIMNNLEFNNSYSWQHGENNRLYSGADFTSRANYGKFQVSDGYLKFSPKAVDVGTTSSTKFGLFLNSDSNIYDHQLVSADSCDYLIVDFDVWSDTGMMPNVRFDFTVLGKNSKTYEDMFFLNPEILYESEEQHFALRTYIEEYPGGATLMYKVIDDITQKQHITCWFDMSDFSVNFLNGNLTFPASSDVNYIGSLLEFTFDIYEHEVAENESLCIDNFCVSTYGNGSGKYDGDISKVYDSWVNNPEDKDKWLSIYDCTDWVLYDKYKNEKGED